MTWELDSGEVLSASGAKTTGRALYDRDEYLRAHGNSWWFSSYTLSATGAWETVVSAYVYLPTFTASGDIMYVYITTGGSPTNGKVRLLDVASATAGTELAAAATVTLDLTLGAWGSAPRQFSVQAYKDGGTMTIESGTQLGNVWF